MGRKGSFRIGLIGVGLFFGASVHGSQHAHVLFDQTSVYSSMAPDATEIGHLAKGTQIEVSSQLVKSPKGSYWYKVQLPSGGLGFVKADQLDTSTLRHDLKAAGVGNETDDIDKGPAPWTFVLRGMGGGGTGLAALGFVPEWGGEGEATFCVPLAAHGFLHRQFSLGAAWVAFDQQDPVLAGSFVVRFFVQDHQFEPELRLRFGQALNSQKFVGGLNFGLDYPFSMTYGAHFSGYIEVGSLVALDVSVVHIWGSAGLGLHF